MRMMVGLMALALMAGCAAPGPVDCEGGETLVDTGDGVVVMTRDCDTGGVQSRPATPADLARLEAPL